MRAAIYTRISEDRDGKKAGVARQRTDCEALCDRRGWQIAAYFEDNDRSAFNGRERPAYQQLVRAVTAGDVDVVVAWHDDRLWRSVLEQQTFLVLGRQSGLKLVATPRGDYDPADGDDTFMSTLMAAVAQKESADKSRRQKRKCAEKAALGQFAGGKSGFGYRLTAPGVLEVDETEGELIRAGAHHLLAGGSTRSIALDWQRRNIPTVTGKVWRTDTIATLMQGDRVAGLRSMSDGRKIARRGPRSSTARRMNDL